MIARRKSAGYTVFFDLDHTILDTSSGRVLFRLSREEGIMGRGMLARGMVMPARN